MEQKDTISTKRKNLCFSPMHLSGQHTRFRVLDENTACIPVTGWEKVVNYFSFNWQLWFIIQNYGWKISDWHVRFDVWDENQGCIPETGWEKVVKTTGNLCNIFMKISWQFKAKENSQMILVNIEIMMAKFEH